MTSYDALNVCAKEGALFMRLEFEYNVHGMGG